MNKSFLQVDVFTSQPLRGNPAAVVFDADDLDARTMQRIAREMNLSETVFVLAPESPDTDYRVRIFTPSSELPFAGHPTIATASAVRAHRGDLVDASLLRQACGIGIVPVEVVPTEGSPIYWMTQASPQFRNTAIGPGEMSALLGCDANMLAAMPVEVVSTGIPWLIAELRSIGCGVVLIGDGDVAGVIAVTDEDTTIDMYMGQGGAPEGVLAAAALRCVGGQFNGRLVFRNEDEKARARKWGIEDLGRIYKLEDLAKGDCIFAATGVTDGSLLGGVKRRRKPTGEVIHFNPWRDFNDAAPQEDPFGIEPDADQLATFLDVVFGYCEGLIPVRGFVDKGQGRDGKPNNIWIDADAAAIFAHADRHHHCRRRSGRVRPA